MPCYSPLTAYYSREIGKSGKRGITFDRNASFSGSKLMLPCGQCVGCRLERSRQWAVRCMNEKRLYSESSFLTLTYEDKKLPDGGTLVPRDLQLFMKRLRKELGSGLRFYACGEYGDENRRPHYHVLLFNADFPDKRIVGKSGAGHQLYDSKMLSGIWKDGLHWIGDVTFESCAYVARYVMKKMTGEMEELYDLGTGVVLEPEFQRYSIGLGKGYFEKYREEIYAHDNVVIKGKKVRPPRYYDNKFDLIDPARLAVLKKKRRRAALLHREDGTVDRRRVRELVELKRLANFKRNVR